VGAQALPEGKKKKYCAGMGGLGVFWFGRRVEGENQCFRKNSSTEQRTDGKKNTEEKRGKLGRGG